MSQDTPTVYDVANAFYHAVSLTAVTGAYAMLGRKLFKFDVGDPSKDFEAIPKLAIAIVPAYVTIRWLVVKKILPPDIPKNY
jgi:hypothetical protein